MQPPTVSASTAPASSCPSTTAAGSSASESGRRIRAEPRHAARQRRLLKSLGLKIVNQTCNLDRVNDRLEMFRDSTFNEN